LHNTKKVFTFAYMTRHERLNERNKKVRQLFNKMCTANPKWRIDAIIEDVADKCFLAPRTIEAIISHEGIYDENYQRQESTQLKLL
jgi:Mg2+ and Co2+ transporter CorA